MAKIDVVLSAKVAWWVRPYLAAIALLARICSPFVCIDDDRIDGFAERHGNFIAKHGIRFVASQK
ncbi:hypothetical protein [Pelagibacterium sp. H642]|uniref:hypothetical protein n=1 Tax=Pelagibacterium sp. H642 TaxID=1881069 RepID=UPI002816293C|nr:hypothetical protein [Pelagibacterium sp. H642]WMT90142.1 hypothetical protein NO934_15290 [Pelagibacterium sp. H642]